MAHLLFLGLQVTGRGLVRRNNAGNPLGHPDPGVLERGDLVRIVRNRRTLFEF
jgi:hypothetical protein